MSKKVTKQELIKKHLIKKGNITSWEAITLYSATRLSAIIFNLKKKGFNISTSPLVRKDANGNQVTFAKYKLVGMPKSKI